MMFHEKLADGIRSARVSVNMTQKELAQVIGVASSSVSMYESGKRMPSLVIASRISMATDTSLDDMVPVSEAVIPTCCDGQMSLEIDDGKA